MEDFKKENNIKMLLEIANEENMIPLLNDGTVHIHYFMKKMNDFIEHEKNSRKTIKQLNIEFLQNLIQTQPQPQPKTTNTISNQLHDKTNQQMHNVSQNANQNPNQNSFKTEYIERAGRNPEWEQQMKKKEREFQESIQKKIPEEPNFRDNIDGPIQNMENLIAQTIQMRNYEMNEIQSQMKKPSQGTSIKYIKIGEEVSMKPDWIDLDEYILDDTNEDVEDKGNNTNTNTNTNWRINMENELNQIKHQLADLTYLFRTFVNIPESTTTSVSTSINHVFFQGDQEEQDQEKRIEKGIEKGIEKRIEKEKEQEKEQEEYLYANASL